jgi:hypothetical protein
MLACDETHRPDDGGSKHVCNVGKLLPDYTAQQPRRNHLHSLLISSEFGSNYRCEKLFSLKKGVRSRTRTRLIDEHLEGCMRIATAKIIPGIERLPT